MTFTTSIMRLNLQLVKVFQFIKQFKLNIRHKLGKKHIILDILSHLTSVKIIFADSLYLELDALFLYNITLVEIYLTLLSKILVEYNLDAW